MKLFIVLIAISFLATSLALKSRSRLLGSTGSSYKLEGCNCLNGGTCKFYSYSRRYRCHCLMGYEGAHCDIDFRAQCYNERGQDYRGKASKTFHGRDCLNWNSPMLHEEMYNAGRKDALELGLGDHNYCRNPDGASKPWCYYQSGLRIVSMHCDIPTCKTDSENAPACGQRSHKLFRIVQGKSTPIESQPWIATIFWHSKKYNQNTFKCGGSLVHPCWVMSAAHCFQESKQTENYNVVLGKSKLYETDHDKEQRFQVEKIILHEHYSDETGAYTNDIALVKIISASGQCAVENDYVQTVCLPPSNLVLKDGYQCEVAGYGQEDSSDWFYSEILKSTKVQLISQQVCRSTEYYGKLITNNMLCAGDPHEWKTDACQGDSGGPLSCEYNGNMVLYGIISWGEECAKQNKPGVYAKVTHFLPWINSHMKTHSVFKSRTDYE
ncbi:urokinase-type plasminogen activator [Microcaecilia unicolor]|uniref:Urokinase-type plasminogen activator n=1 Tax=Microcaecilia unicolor TaxID=1415580 RepID=A0A6P7Y1T4_9AMPH|nr:urokinase-type plasminogen activator [Microcaecilia unicolor]